MAVLAQGVPLTLLLDLAPAGGPESARIYARETADLAWLAGLRDSVAAERVSAAGRSSRSHRAG